MTKNYDCQRDGVPKSDRRRHDRGPADPSEPCPMPDLDECIQREDDGVGRSDPAVEAKPTAAEVTGEAVGKWEGAEEWMPLAWELCAEENGEDSCEELVWEGGPIPEPWGDRWLKYEDEAKRLIALVRRCVPLTTPSASPSEAQKAVATVQVWNKGGSGEFVTATGIEKLPDGTLLYTHPSAGAGVPQEVAMLPLDAVLLAGKFAKDEWLKTLSPRPDVAFDLVPTWRDAFATAIQRAAAAAWGIRLKGDKS